MSEASDTRRAFRWSWLRHAVQAAALVLFAAPVLAAGWSLFGTSVGGDDAAATPAQLPFFGSLSSSSIGGLDILDPFGALQVIAASKTFELDWLLAALPVLIVYGLIRGRAFCGWVCPVNLLLEIVDFARRKLRIDVREMPVPRHAKLWIALAVLCPLGGFYEALGRFGQVNVKIDPAACIHCDACKHACLSDPAILEPALDGCDAIVRAGDCMACGSCIDACPTRALSFTLGRASKPAAPNGEE